MADARPDPATGAGAAIVGADERARLRSLIRSTLAVETPPLTPELKFWAAADYLDIWTATEAELDANRLGPPFWAFAWPGGQALARYALDRPDEFAGKRVLALAAGAGLEAIAAAGAGALRATANDVDPAALVAAEMNAALNGAALALDGRDLLDDARAALWSTPQETLGDVILVGDLFYERDLAERAWERLSRAAAAGATVLIGDPSRGRLPEGVLERIAAYDVPTPRALEDKDRVQTWIWRPR